MTFELQKDIHNNIESKISVKTKEKKKTSQLTAFYLPFEQVDFINNLVSMNLAVCLAEVVRFACNDLMDDILFESEDFSISFSPKLHEKILLNEYDTKSISKEHCFVRMPLKFLEGLDEIIKTVNYFSAPEIIFLNRTVFIRLALRRYSIATNKMLKHFNLSN